MTVSAAQAHMGATAGCLSLTIFLAGSPCPSNIWIPPLSAPIMDAMGFQATRSAPLMSSEFLQDSMAAVDST